MMTRRGKRGIMIRVGRVWYDTLWYSMVWYGEKTEMRGHVGRC